MQKRLQESASKPSNKQENITTSGCLSMESSKLVPTGQKPTRPRYLEDKTRMTVGGKRYRVGNQNHPYHLLYKKGGHRAVYKAMGLYDYEADLELLREYNISRYEEVKCGDVYIISNPAWPGWYKIGMAVSAKDRLKAFQTSSPLRDYRLEHSVFTKNKRTAESKVFKVLQHHENRENEWFQVDLDYAISVLELLR